MKVRKGQKKVTVTNVDQLYAIYWIGHKANNVRYPIEIVTEDFMAYAKAYKVAPDKRPRWITAKYKSNKSDDSVDLIFHPPAPTAGNLIIKYSILKEI